MSSGSGDARKRPGFMESFRAALTPPPLPPDDGKPLVRPRTVTVASILAMAAGAVFVFIGGFSLVTTNAQLDSAISAYNSAIIECTTKFGGIGDAVVIPAGLSSADQATAEACKTYIVLTDDAISGARTQSIVVSTIVLVVGLIAAAGGWFIRAGNRWGRMAVVGAIVLSLILSLAFGVSNIFTLGGSLLLIVAAMLCLIGQGGAYFARLKARRTG